MNITSEVSDFTLRVTCVCICENRVRVPYYSTANKPREKMQYPGVLSEIPQESSELR